MISGIPTLTLRVGKLSPLDRVGESPNLRPYSAVDSISSYDEISLVAFAVICIHSCNIWLFLDSHHSLACLDHYLFVGESVIEDLKQFLTV
jgi:hypothetical protein